MVVESAKPSVEPLRHPMSDVECRGIFDIHAKSLPDDVMPNFGCGAERRYLHALSNHRGVVIVARTDAETVGFLLLRFDAIRMTQFLSIGAVAQFLWASLGKPKLFVRLFYQLLNARPNPPGSAEIDYFAVDERCRGRGIGEALLAEAESLTLQRGLKQLFTKTNNERLRQHYTDKKGAREVYRFAIRDDMYFGLVWDVKAS